MSDLTHLEIHLTSGSVTPLPGSTSWNEHRGGPEVLLRWLESQLGLLEDRPPLASRVTDYAAVLDGLPDACFASSLATDRWATAGELLSRRDELRLAGWDETDSPRLPSLVRDLARATQIRKPRWPDESERLQHVLDALTAGQLLPPHRCVLRDDPTRWPRRWREVLARLHTQLASEPTPSGSIGSSLAAVQQQVLDGSLAPAPPDASLLWIRSRSVLGACEAVALALAADPTRLAETVIYCESPAAAICLDGCLARLGLPTAGAAVRTLSHPVLQVLPLVLRLCWGPVDPSLLLDFLSLPVSPIPPRARRRLAEALTEQPGLGSAAWEAAREALCDPQVDAEGTLAERLRLWLDIERRTWGEPLPAALVRERCGLVARWAHGRARVLEDDGQADPALAEALRIAVGQAATLGDLVGAHAAEVSEAQLGRLLDAALAEGAHIQPCLQAAGGPRLVTSLAEIIYPCARLVWLGLSTSDLRPCRWTALELRQLRAMGVDLDDGSRSLAALREAERRGLSRVTEALLAVALPDDAEQRPHPLWLQVWQTLHRAGEKDPLGLEDVLTAARRMDHTPWRFPTSAAEIRPPQPRRPLWSVERGLLRERTRSSASELESRLACPLQWVLKYAGRLQSGAIARLPDAFQLKGSFCHDLLRGVFGGGKPAPDVATAERVMAEAFEARLALDAAPLAQPARLAEKLQLREELLRATRSLVQALWAGGYQVQGFEVDLQGGVRGRTLDGAIDCLVRRVDGEEAIVDFKYGGIKKYRALLEEGRAVQLATYAYGRSQARPYAFPAVGYLILSDGILYTPQGSRLRGDGPSQVVEGPPIAEVWAAFLTALERAEAWLTGGEPIPARPLQDPQDWPPGASIVLDPPDAKGRQPESQRICEYCDYGVLCGLVELT